MCVCVCACVCVWVCVHAWACSERIKDPQSLKKRQQNPSSGQKEKVRETKRKEGEREGERERARERARARERDCVSVNVCQPERRAC